MLYTLYTPWQANAARVAFPCRLLVEGVSDNRQPSNDLDLASHTRLAHFDNLAICIALTLGRLPQASMVPAMVLGGSKLPSTPPTTKVIARGSYR